MKKWDHLSSYVFTQEDLSVELLPISDYFFAVVSRDTKKDHVLHFNNHFYILITLKVYMIFTVFKTF